MSYQMVRNVKLPWRLVSQRTSAPDDVTLVVEKAKVRVPAEWLPRWTFLQDIVSDMGVSEIEWTRTGLQELIPWIELNERMDRAENRVDNLVYQHPTLLPISSMDQVVSFMLPVDANYLLQCYIDEDVPFARRHDLYRDLGHWIRSRVLIFSYNSRLARSDYVIHRDLDLNEDMAYGVHYHSRVILPQDLPEGILEAILRSPLNVVTGIVHTGWILSRTKAYPASESRLLDEVPWDTIRWNDLLDMVPNAQVNTMLPTIFYLVLTGIRFPDWDRSGLEHIGEALAASSADDIIPKFTSMISSDSDILVRSHEPDKQLYRLLAGRVNESGSVIAATNVRITTRRDQLRLMVPAAPRLIKLISEWMNDNNASVVSREILSSHGGRNTLTWAVGIFTIITILVLQIGWGGHSRMSTIDSSEYREILSTVNSTLGSSVVELIARGAVTHLENPLPADIYHREVTQKKKEMLAEAALDVLNEEGYREFTGWPVVPRV